MKIDISACILSHELNDQVKKTVSSVVGHCKEVVILATTYQAYLELVQYYQCVNVVIYYKKWNYNFSEMRNHLTNHSKYDIVFHIDSDEYATDEFFSELTYALEAYDFSLSILEITVEDESGAITPNLPRIFSKHVCHFEGFVHELAVAKLEQTTVNYIHLDTPISHSGYVIEDMKVKLNRNLDLGAKNLVHYPNNIRWVFFFIKESTQIGNFKDAIKFKNLISCFKYQDNAYISGCYCYLLIALINTGEIQQARELLKLSKLDSCDRHYFSALISLAAIEDHKVRMAYELSKIDTFIESDIDINGFHVDMLQAKLEILNQNFSRAMHLFSTHYPRSYGLASSLKENLITALEEETQ